MILPKTDHWKHQYLIDLLDENALTLVTSLTEASKRLPAIQEFVRIPDAPHLGPELLAELHEHALHHHRDPEWINAHQGARQYYLARAESLFDRGQSVLTRAGVFSDPQSGPGPVESAYPDPELAEWDDLAGQSAELMNIWEGCGRSHNASTQLLLITQVVPRRLQLFATGITFAILEFHTAGHNLTAMRSSERSEALGLGAVCAIRLARLLPDRCEEFRTRALVLAFQALSGSSSGTGPAVSNMKYVAAEAADLLPAADPGRAALTELSEAAGESVANGFDVIPTTELAAQLDLPDAGYLDSAAMRCTYRLGRTATTFPDSLSDPDESNEDSDDTQNALVQLDIAFMTRFNGRRHLMPGPDYDPDSLRSQTLVAMSRAMKEQKLHLEPADLQYLVRTTGSTELIPDEARALLDTSKHWVDEAGQDHPDSQILTEVMDLLVEAAEQRMPPWLIGLLLDRGEDRLGTRLHLEVAKRQALLGWHHRSQPFFHVAYMKSLDRLASIATAVDPLRTEPQAPETRSAVEIAKACLLELLEYPALTADALSRIPMHRLSDADREQLRQTLSARLEVFTGDPVTDPEFWATEAVELTLLRAIDNAEGAPWMFVNLEEED